MDKDQAMYWLGIVGLGAAAYWYFYMKPSTMKVPLAAFAPQYQGIVKGLIDAGWTVDNAGNATNTKTGEKYNIYQASA